MKSASQTGVPTRSRKATLLGWLALAYGILGTLALLALLGFYIFQVPRMPMGNGSSGTQGFNLGFLNDLLTMLAALFLMFFAILLPGLTMRARQRGPLVIALPGTLGTLGIVLTMAAFILGRISLLQQAVFYALCFGPLGLWHIAANTFDPAARQLSSRLRGLGRMVGLGELVAFTAFNVFGGWRVLSTTDFSPFLTNYPLILGTVLGGFTGYIGGPLWAIGLGRTFLMESKPSPAPPHARIDFEKEG